MEEYIVVYARSTIKLVEQVNYRLKTGWMTVGGIAVGSTAMYEGYYQSMLKITPEPYEPGVNPKKTLSPCSQEEFGS